MCGVRGGEREEDGLGSRMVTKSLSEMFEWAFGVVIFDEQVCTYVLCECVYNIWFGGRLHTKCTSVHD